MSIWSRVFEESHKHKCVECGLVWEHVRDNIQDNEAAHRCPNCQSLNYQIFHGREKACCVFTGVEDVSKFVSRTRQNI